MIYITQKINLISEILGDSFYTESRDYTDKDLFDASDYIEMIDMVFEDHKKFNPPAEMIQGMLNYTTEKMYSYNIWEGDVE